MGSRGNPESEGKEMKGPEHKGECLLCGGTFGKPGMSRHLGSCARRESETQGKGEVFHIVVDAAYLPEYWMHLEADADAKLKDLDDFLRGIWLECCGHLSLFRVGDKSYAFLPQKEYGDKSLNVALKTVLGPGMRFFHEYDFGSTTELRLRVLSKEGRRPRGKIRLLARNVPPRIECESCGEAAKLFCLECVWAGKGWLCDECAEKHECGEDMLLPVVNSPRTGVCGYTGPSEW